MHKVSLLHLEFPLLSLLLFLPGRLQFKTPEVQRQFHHLCKVVWVAIASVLGQREGGVRGAQLQRQQASPHRRQTPIRGQYPHGAPVAIGIIPEPRWRQSRAQGRPIQRPFVRDCISVQGVDPLLSHLVKRSHMQP